MCLADLLTLVECQEVTVGRLEASKRRVRAFYGDSELAIAIFQEITDHVLRYARCQGGTTKLPHFFQAGEVRINNAGFYYVGHVRPPQR